MRLTQLRLERVLIHMHFNEFIVNQTRLNSSDLNRPSINLHGSDEEGQENRSNFFVKKGEDGLVLGGGKAKSDVTRLGWDTSVNR